MGEVDDGIVLVPNGQLLHIARLALTFDSKWGAYDPDPILPADEESPGPGRALHVRVLNLCLQSPQNGPSWCSANPDLCLNLNLNLSLNLRASAISSLRAVPNC
jgi:hypothetical protein